MCLLRLKDGSGLLQMRDQKKLGEVWEIQMNQLTLLMTKRPKRNYISPEDRDRILREREQR